jgi:PAS domain S-box-containing protein
LGHRDITDLQEGHRLVREEKTIKDAVRQINTEGAAVTIREIAECRQDESVPQKSEERLRLALEVTNAGIFDWLIPEDEIFISPALKESWGLNDDIGGQASIDYWKSRIHSDHRERVINQLQKHLEGNEPFNEDYLFLSKPGAYRWFNSRSIVIFNEIKNPLRMVCSVRDIDNHKKAEELIRNLTRQLIKSQEIERRLISCELYDRVSQDLSAATIECEILMKNKLLQPEIRQHISSISDMLLTVLMVVRNLSYELRPPELERLELMRMLHEYCKQFSEKHGINVTFRFGEINELNVSFDMKINLYRLVQEGLNNIKKHANASHATIKLIPSSRTIILLIKDNGIGFNLKKQQARSSNGTHMGLRNMADRVKLLQGKMDIQSASGKGTKIFIEIPYCEG